MKHASFLAILCVSFSTFGQNANKGFSFQRELHQIQSAGYYELTLPTEIFGRCKDDLADVRIYSIEEHDTTEVPYVMRIKRKRITTQDFSLPEFNRSTKNNTVFITFELPPNTGLSTMELTLDEPNFFASVTIEGSDDKSTWFEVSTGQKIFGVHNNYENYRYTRVSFPETRYRFIRLSIASDHLLKYQRTVFKAEQVFPGEFLPAALTWKVAELKKEKQSRIDIRLGHYQPLAMLQVVTQNNKDFYRKCSIDIVSDSTKTEKGWLKNYRHVADGYITSFLDNIFDLSNQSAAEIRITIENNDDSPIEIHDVKASSPAVKLIANMKPGRNYLFYGNRSMSFPNYDLRYFEAKLPAAIPSITTGPEVSIESTSLNNALLENKIWLWAIILVGISVLGFFTVRMMKAQQAT